MAATSPIVPPASIAVIGLGNMGIPMSNCLIKAGFRVSGFDASPIASARFGATGGQVAASAAEAVVDADVIITLLPDGETVRSVLEPLRGDIKPGTVIMEMSSSDPVGTQALGKAFIAAGFGFIDAPVSGGVKRAVDGSLAIMVGGEATTIDRMERILSEVGRTVFRTGGLGSGHAMKALNNYVSAAGLIATVEAIQIGEKFGLDVAMMADVLNASTGRNNTTEVKLKQFILSKAFNAGFPMKLMAKDVRTAADLGDAMHTPTPLADRCADIWDEAAASLGDGVDHTAIGLHIEKMKHQPK